MSSNDWEQRKLSELSEKTFGGGTPKTSNESFWKGNIPWIQSSDLIEGSLFDIEPRKYISQEAVDKSATKLVPENSVAIVTRVGVGKLAFMPFSYATSQDFLSLSVLKTEPQFTVYALYKKLQSELNAVQGTSIKGVTKNELLAKEIMIPCYEEQEKIGSYLHSLDHLITLHHRKYMKYADLSVFDWEQRKFGEIVQKYEDPVETPAEGYMRLGIRSHAKGTFHSYVEKGKELETAKMFRVAANNFIVNITFGWEHAVAITDESDAGKLVSHRFPQYSFKEGMNPRFFKYLILDECFRHHLELSSPGGAGRNRVLKLNEMLEYKMKFPQMEEQEEIAIYFEQLDNLITLHQRKCEETKTLKKYMLQKMFPQNGHSVPEIRFSGFTEDWEQRKFGEIVQKYEDPVETPAEGYMRLGIRSHAKGTFHSYVEKGKELETAKMFRVAANNFIVNITFGWEHAVAITDESDAGKLVSHRFPQYSFKEGMNPRFFKYLILDECFRHHLELSSPGGAGRNRVLKLNEMLEYKMKFPQMEEQEEIAIYFEQLDNLITLHQRKCEETKTLKKYMLQKMFPQNGHSVPEIRFSGFTEDWEQRKFADVVDIGSGMDYKHLEEGNIPVYGTGGYLLSVNKALSDDKDAIGIGRKGTIDKPYILRAPFWTVDTLFYCIPKENYDLDFTSCIFQNVDWKKKDESTGVPSLSKVIINNVETATPTMDEQQKIGEYFSNLDHLITLHHRKQNYVLNTLIYAKTTLFITKTS